ncbi:hypothetical protein VPH35_089208 [Triticum aestivum]
MGNYTYILYAIQILQHTWVPMRMSMLPIVCLLILFEAHMFVDSVSGLALEGERKANFSMLQISALWLAMVRMEVKLAFPQDRPPLSVISAAKIAGVSIIIDPTLASGSVPTLHFSSGDFIHGVNTILRYIARAASVSSFYGQDDIQAAQVDQWLKYTPLILSGSEFEAACSFLDGYLANRAFLVGYGLSIADIVVWSNLTGHHGSIVISFLICCCLASQKKKARVISSFWIFSIITSSQSEPNI